MRQTFTFGFAQAFENTLRVYRNTTNSQTPQYPADKEPQIHDHPALETRISRHLQDEHKREQGHYRSMDGSHYISVLSNLWHASSQLIATRLGYHHPCLRFNNFEPVSQIFILFLQRNLGWL